MRVECFRDGICEYCDTHMEPASTPDPISVGDVLTVVADAEFLPGWKVFRFAEIPCPDGCYWCSCCFREIDDREAWKRLMERHKSKPKRVLEPA